VNWSESFCIGFLIGYIGTLMAWYFVVEWREARRIRSERTCQP
jgi:hypothetical protein